MLWLGLVILAPLAVLAHFSVFTTVVILALIGGFSWKRKFSALLKPEQDTILETFPVSHYVEKARWSMDYLGIPYQEQQNVGVLGMLLKVRMVPRLYSEKHRTSIEGSDNILRYLWGQYSTEPKAKFLEPTREALSLEALMDDFGMHIRRVVYYYVLPDYELSLKVWGLRQAAVPEWQRNLLRPARPVLTAFIRKALKVDRSGAERSLEVVRETFNKIDEKLSDNRKFILGGQEPTFVDITWASLSALAVLPDNYGTSVLDDSRLNLKDLDPKLQDLVKEMRDRPAGKFTLRMYEEFREPQPVVAKAGNF